MIDNLEELDKILLRKKYLKKKSFRVMMLTMISYISLEIIYYVGVFSVFPMIDLFLMVFSISENIRNFVILSFNLILLILRPISLIIGTNQMSKIRRESNELTMDIKQYIDKETSKRDTLIVNDIMNNFTNLSRSEQMQILNYTKDLLQEGQVKKDKIHRDKRYIEIDMLDDDAIDSLQEKIEDVLFPDDNIDNQMNMDNNKTNIENYSNDIIDSSISKNYVKKRIIN